VSQISENVGVSTSHNPKGLHGLYRDNFTLPCKTSKDLQYMKSVNFHLLPSISVSNIVSFQNPAFLEE
jgi:hypothetical protein